MCVCAEVAASLPHMPPAQGIMGDYTLAKEVAGYVHLLAECVRQVVMMQRAFTSAVNAVRWVVNVVMTQRVFMSGVNAVRWVVRGDQQVDTMTVSVRH